MKVKRLAEKYQLKLLFVKNEFQNPTASHKDRMSPLDPIWKRAIEKMGAEIIYTASSEDRWTFLQEKVQKEGWYPAANFITPPVGINKKLKY